MEFTLAAVTVLALCMTVAMGAVTWRVVREERRRSAARLAALEAAIKNTPATASVHPREATDHVGELPVSRSDQPPLAVTASLEAAADTGDRQATVLFRGTTDITSEWSRQLAAVGVASVLLVAAVTGLLLGTADRSHDVDPSAVDTLQIELLALDHTRQGDRLAITGSVRNPAGYETSQLTVVATTFDERGELVASSRVPLPQQTLGPGEAAPFEVSLPGERATRYRISFAIADVTVPHVDRRPQVPTADDEHTEL